MKSPLSIRILYWLTNIVFWLMVLIAAVVFVANLVFLTDVDDVNFQLRIQMPVSFELVEEGIVSLSSVEHTVKIEKALGNVYLVETPFFLTKIMARAIFIVLLLGLFMMWRFKQLVTNLKNGLFFINANVLNIKQIAYGLLALWIITKVYMELMYHFFVKNLEFETIIIGSERLDNNYMVQLALLLWVMAHVFGKGIELRDYKDLTI